jgi:hypothetical protein
LTSSPRTRTDLPSLFVLALPRSLSSHVFEVACAALGLRAPTWTSAGEVLNFERWRMLPGEGLHEHRFVTKDDAVRFEQLSHLLDDLVQPSGRAYKDVVQPFVAAYWIAGPLGRSLRAMRIDRPVADVAWSMLHAGWDYPAAASKLDGDRIDQLLSGLLLARRTHKETGTVELQFDQLLQNPSALTETLAQLYPEATITEEWNDDADFQAHSRTVLDRRRTPLWQELDERTRNLCARSSGASAEPEQAHG